MVGALNLAYALRGQESRVERVRAVLRGVQDYRQGAYGVWDELGRSSRVD